MKPGSISLISAVAGLAVAATLTSSGLIAPAASDLLAGPYLTSPAQTGMTVMWIRSASGPCTLRWGIGELTNSAEVTHSGTGAGSDGTEYIYEKPLSGLAANTLYDYQVETPAGTASGTFRTLAAAPAESRFVFVSDGHGNAPVVSSLAARFAGHNPAFVLHGGDITDAGETYTNWRPGFFTPMAGVLDRLSFAPTHGNHESDGTVYRKVFALPGDEYWYSFDHGDVHVVVVNSNLYRLTPLQPLIPAMKAWCQADLAASTAKWKIVVHHQPFFDLGRRGDTDQLSRVGDLKDLLPIYRAGGVDLILSGHAHVYARYKPMYKTEADRSHPITQIIGSGGGGSLSVAHMATPHLAAGESTYHYLAFTATAGTLSGQAIRPDGTVIDSFTITKTDGEYDEDWLALAQPEDEFGRVIITGQPESATVDVGATATFTVTAVGAQNSNSALYYQWMKNGVDIVGATGKSYTTAAAAAGDSGTCYAVRVWNYYNSVRSHDAALFVSGVPTAPVILAQPQDVVADLGDTPTFEVVAAGSPTLTYQWRKNGVDIEAATGTAYTTPEVTLADEGALYSVVVTNGAGSTASEEAVLRLRPVIAVTPASVTQSVTSGGSAGRQLTVTNSGDGRLDWTVALVGAGFKAVDSKTAGGPAYSWTDISGTGTALAMGDETVSDPLPLGFSFPFYGGSFTTVRVCSNGYLSFTSTGCKYDNLTLPGDAAPADLVAPLWDDLDPGAGGTVYYQQTDADTFVVQFEAVRFFDSDLTATFQVILKSDGTIAFQYKALGRANTVTAGVQDETKTRGLELVCNAAYLENEMAVKLYPATSWLSFAPQSGQTTAGGGTTAVDLTLAAGTLPLGVYEETLRFSSNDPAHPTVDVPVSMTVTAANTPPVISAYFPETPHTMWAGSSQVFSVDAWDPDAGDTLSYLWKLDGEPVGTNASTYSYGPAIVGSHTIEVSVSDGQGGVTTHSWAVTVLSTDVTLLAPVGKVSQRRPEFSWGAVTGAEKYELWVRDCTSGTNPVLHEEALVGTTYTPGVDLVWDHTYEWWVRAYAGGSWAPWRSYTFFVVVSPDPVLLAPRGAKTEKRPEFSWGAVSGAEQYEIWVRDCTSGTNPVINDSTITGTSYTPGADLTLGHTYEWWLRARVGGTWVPWRSYTFFVIVPGNPVLVSPRGPVSQKRPEFSWEAVAGAEKYEIWVRDCTSGTNPVLNVNTITGTTYTPGVDLTLGHVYEWWVRAYAGGAWAPWRSYTFCVVVPGDPVLTAPQGTVGQLRPEFSWEAVAEATKYEIWVRDCTDGTNPVLNDATITGTTYTPGVDLTAGHTYEWWLRAYGGGAWAPWRSYKYFSVEE